MTDSPTEPLPDGVDVPAHLEPYVVALGLERAVTFFLAFGGSPAYVAKRPERRSAMRDVIGEDGIKALSRLMDGRIARVPMPRKWLARARFAQGRSIYEIARELHTTDKTIRRWLMPERDERRQMSLPL